MGKHVQMMDRTTLIWRAEALERRTKAPGRQSGAIGQSGIAVLRAIAFHFYSKARAAAWPSYTALQAATGFCRQTVAAAIKRLEAAGLLLVTRRAGWNGSRIVRETNIYRLPAGVPGGFRRFPVDTANESLGVGRQPKTQGFIPWERWESPVKAALEALGQRIRRSG